MRCSLSLFEVGVPQAKRSSAARREYAFVFSFNYFPVVAIACKACKVPYVSWTYDSPFIQLYSKTLGFDTNFVYVFDSHTVRELQAMGYQYIPRAEAEQKRGLLSHVLFPEVLREFLASQSFLYRGMVWVSRDLMRSRYSTASGLLIT